MDTATYRLQCALRHPDLQRDMLSIHQKYPPLFYLRNPEKGHPPLAWLPQEVQPLVVKKDAEHLALVPKTFWDIPLIYDAFALKKEGYQFLIDVDPAYDRVL